MKTLKIHRKFDIAWENIKTIEDIKSLLKGLDITINLTTEEIPKNLKELFDNNLIKEVENENT